MKIVRCPNPGFWPLCLLVGSLVLILPDLLPAAAPPGYSAGKSTLVRKKQDLAAEELRPFAAGGAVRAEPESDQMARDNWNWQYADWLALLRVEALAEGISPTTFDVALAGVVPLPEVLVSDRNQPELKLGLETYLARLVSDRRVAAGKEQLRLHQHLLEEIRARYHVDPRFLVALWGVESDYGRVTGDLPVFAALVTLAYDPRRADYFRKELLAALHLLDEQRINFADLRGSWAGAMGGLQFMPTVFRRFAVDYNGDGLVDVWREPGDLFATGAAYLAASGWRDDQGWGCEVRLTKPVGHELLGHGRRFSLERWRSLGVQAVDGSCLTGPEQEASLIIPDSVSGRAFLVYENFRVLRKWNRSDLYALAVSILADRLVAGEKGAAGK